MQMPEDFWRRKIDAFLSRVPGETGVRGPAPVLMADRVAFGARLSPSSTPASTAELTIEHPLTGVSKVLPDIFGADSTRIAAAVRARAKRIQEAAEAQHPGDAQRQFLALWRFLPQPPLAEDLPELEADQVALLRRWWRLLPAERAAPGSPLWEHQSLVSALAGTADADGSLHPMLVQFNIADTQPFVTRARRTQDLWAGSYLLSFLCWNMLRSFAETYGPDCVLQPLLRGQPLADLWLHHDMDISNVSAPGEERLRISNIPNIFTLILPEPDVQNAVARACDAAFARWEEVSVSARKTMEAAAKWNGQDWDGCEAIWQRQQETFLRDNIFWAALPLPAGELDLAGLLSWRERHGPFLPPHDVRYAQIEQLLTVHPGSGTGGLLYSLCSHLTAQLLSDRKRVRDFRQVHEPGQKCSLSGALQAVYPDPPPGRNDLGWAKEWWEQLASFDAKGIQPRYKMAGRIRRGDRLCAVQATKRLMLQSYFEEAQPGRPRFDRHQFPSTAGIANAHLLTDIVLQARTERAVRDAVSEYVSAIRQGLLTDVFHYPASLLPVWKRAAEGDDLLLQFLRIDGDCLLDEFYEPEALRREFGEGMVSAPDFESRLLAARKARNALIGLVNRKTSRYYAIIAMDGDSMGAWISGKKSAARTQKTGRPLGPAFHLAFTGALSSFALEDTWRIVEEEHAGKLIYAGGDDVLALVPVADLMPVMDALYCAFRGIDVHNENFSGFTERDGVMELRLGDATLSAGAVIAHEAVPLSYALEEARQAEHDAKERHGRDAFAVRLLKRSGAPVGIGGKWRVNGVNVPAAVLTAADLMRLGTLSSKMGYSMQQSHLQPVDNVWSPEALAAAQEAEFRRLVRRSITAPAAEKNAAEKALEPMAQLVALFDPPLSRLKTVGWENGWTATQSLLRLARMIGLET